MTSLVLYGDPFSSATRLVTCVMECLGLRHEFRPVDVRKGENLTTQFQKLNPQGTVPVLVDGTFKLTDSRAIALYLVNQHGHSSSGGGGGRPPTTAVKGSKSKAKSSSDGRSGKSLLYPTIAQDRARTDEMLFFDATVFSRRYQELMTPILHGEPLDEGGVSRMMGLLHALNRRLASTGFLALTDHPTLADLAIFVTVSAVEAMQFMDMSPYEDLCRWLDRCRSCIPNYEKANGRGVDRVVQFYHEMMGMGASDPRRGGNNSMDSAAPFRDASNI